MCIRDSLVGLFQQPDLVFIDVDFLSTLPFEELKSGFAEVIKHGAIASEEYFSFIEKLNLKEITSEELIEVVLGSCRIKSKVVEADEKEHGERKILNFGHTIGHAIESLSHYDGKDVLLHGECVALGMVVEAKIAEYQGLLSKVDSQKLITVSYTHLTLPTKA